MARLAIVDDELNVIRALRWHFEAEGFDVETFTDPLLALPHLICQPPQALILNGSMPGMHGIEFFRRYRRYSRAPVIFYSASADDIEDILSRDGPRAEAYIGKPASNCRLATLVREMISFHTSHTGACP